ncbi:hypothetical protein SAMN05444716_10895 [Streptomyces harbinensis]|uniref:Nephrocystin 3-like N-terminal domain-containing protein n=2 Tax=Streptomyces harbinensis TaxID=1176198 RepID=A0A1I6VI78_9ACTN|nr:hypothetical protein SAMN05444716_10895 [Streptomyces harbinensis]
MKVTSDGEQEERAFHDKLDELRVKASAFGDATPAACARIAGVPELNVRFWCTGEAAPRRHHIEGVRRLVTHLRRMVGEPAVFDVTWSQALEAAQRKAEKDEEADSHPSKSKRRSNKSASGADRSQGTPLRDRKSELMVTLEFIAAEPDGSSPYLWWQGSRGVGKSALLAGVARRALAMENTDVVAYFCTTTEGRGSADHFFADLARQLTKLAGPTGHVMQGPPSPAQLRRLVRAAAARSASAKRRLLIVVDGLDEDAAWWSAPGPASIAALLPHVPESRPGHTVKRGWTTALRVVVASRPSPRLPHDVPADHPLRRPDSVRVLFPTPKTRQLPPVADLTGLKRTVADLLAVARDGLRPGDLAELTGCERARIEDLLYEDEGIHFLPNPLDVQSWVLSDERLPAVPEEARTGALHLLRSWAGSWRQRGWSAATPPFLVSHYPHLLSGTDFARCVADPVRQTWLVTQGRLDEALGQVTLAPVGEIDDLGVAAEVALSRHLLLQRARPAPRELVRLFALAGDVTRARGQALSAPGAVARAVWLADIVEVLGEGSPEAHAIAREAAAWAERAAAEELPPDQEDHRFGELTAAGTTLHDHGMHEAAHTVWRAVLLREDAAWTTRLDAARRLAPELPGLLHRIAHHAEALSEGDTESRAEALRLWGELAKEQLGGQPLSERRVEDYIEEFCAGLTPESSLTDIDLLARAAMALARTRPKQARALARRALGEVREALRAPGARSEEELAQLRLGLSTTLALVVLALKGLGDRASGEDLPEAVPERLTLDLFGEDVREPVRTALRDAPFRFAADPPAQAGESAFASVVAALRTHPVRGRQLLLEALHRSGEKAQVPGPQEWMLPLAGALAAGGHVEKAQLLIQRAGEPKQLAPAAAALSLACSVGGHTTAAGDRARAAATGPVDDDPAVRGLIAQAFAHAGEPEAAQEWAGREGAARSARPQVERTAAAVAVGLAAHAPDVAARIVEDRLARAGRAAMLPVESISRQRLLPEVAGLLLALTDPRRPDDSVCTLLRALGARPRNDIKKWPPDTILVQALLDAAGCVPGIGLPPGRMRDWERYMATAKRAEGTFVFAEWAVLQAFRGDLGAARSTAGLGRTARERTAALAAVAAYLGRVPVVAPAADGWAVQDASVLRFISLADALGADATRDAEQARLLTREVLASEHWWYALPLLPTLAPQVLPRLAESALGHTLL